MQLHVTYEVINVSQIDLEPEDFVDMQEAGVDMTNPYAVVNWAKQQDWFYDLVSECTYDFGVPSVLDVDLLDDDGVIF